MNFIYKLKSILRIWVELIDFVAIKLNITQLVKTLYL